MNSPSDIKKRIWAGRDAVALRMKARLTTADLVPPERCRRLTGELGGILVSHLDNQPCWRSPWSVLLRYMLYLPVFPTYSQRGFYVGVIRCRHLSSSSLRVDGGGGIRHLHHRLWIGSCRNSRKPVFAKLTSLLNSVCRFKLPLCSCRFPRSFLLLYKPNQFEQKYL